MKKQETNQPYWTTPHGTKYDFINEQDGMVRARIDFTVNLKRLLLFEEFCDMTGKFFPIVAKDAIWQKMENEIRNAKTEEIGNYIKEEYLKRWDSNTGPLSLQDPVN